VSDTISRYIEKQYDSNGPRSNCQSTAKASSFVDSKNHLPFNNVAALKEHEMVGGGANEDGPIEVRS
jgi:hypothetical protein